MTDQAPRPARFHCRDTGAHRRHIGIDRGFAARDHLACTATCRCGTTIAADSLTDLRDLVACHMTACDG